MEKLNDSWVENRILRTLKKRGFPDNKTIFERTYFGNLPADVLLDIKIQPIGLAVVALFDYTKKWTLLGTNSIFCNYNGLSCTIKIDSIQSTRIINSTSSPPQKCEYIQVVDNNGKTFTLWGPMGSPCLALSGVLHVLLNIKAKN